jgi:metal-dependent hydrolase (beta-lactamase superfamily II)
MNKMKILTLFFLILMLTGCYPQKNTQNKIINTYTVLEETDLRGKNIPPGLKTPGPFSGVFNVLIISERVDKNTPLYKMISQLEIKDSIKNKLLKNITDGTLKIYFDLGKSQKAWKNDYLIFEKGLQKTGLKALSSPPDFIIISHAHGPNYMGGIEYLQKKYPHIPIFITPDMKEGLICFDYEKAVKLLKEKNARLDLYGSKFVKIKNPIVLRSGITALTKHISIITQEFRHKWENLISPDGKNFIQGFKTETEYENILTVDTKEGIAMFTTCMHSSFLEAIKKAMGLFNKEVYLYCGGFEDENYTITEAKKISPILKFLFYHCAPAEYFISKFGGTFIKRITGGEKIYLDIVP